MFPTDDLQVDPLVQEVVIALAKVELKFVPAIQKPRRRRQKNVEGAWHCTGMAGFRPVWQRRDVDTIQQCQDIHLFEAFRTLDSQASNFLSFLQVLLSEEVRRLLGAASLADARDELFHLLSQTTERLVQCVETRE